MELIFGIIGALFGGLCTWLATERQVRYMRATQKQQNEHLQQQLNDQKKQVGLINIQVASKEIAAIQTIFIDHPEIWPYFHLGEDAQLGKTTQDHRIYYLCKATARRMVSAFAFELLHRDPGVDGYNSSWVEPSIKRYYANSPVLRRQLIDHFDEYPVTRERQLELLIGGTETLLTETPHLHAGIKAMVELDKDQAQRLSEKLLAEKSTATAQRSLAP